MRSGTILAVAFLPPREVGGEISEAMYLGDEPRSEPPGTFLTDEQVDAREAESILHEELARH
jgi:predicted RNA-binding protein with EMAP domain